MPSIAITSACHQSSAIYGTVAMGCRSRSGGVRFTSVDHQFSAYSQTIASISKTSALVRRSRGGVERQALIGAGVDESWTARRGPHCAPAAGEKLALGSVR
jgi:hypothetical protein